MEPTDKTAGTTIEKLIQSKRARVLWFAVLSIALLQTEKKQDINIRKSSKA